jgi:hypothetical protein
MPSGRFANGSIPSPRPMKRRRTIWADERAFEGSELAELNLVPSVQPRVVSESDRPSRLYWDALSRSEVEYDPQGWIARQLSLTAQWLALAGARRHVRRPF